MKIIVEGLDRLGKDTLIDLIQHSLGYHQVLHFSKPRELRVYNGNEQVYQQASFRQMFNILNSVADVICNRAHLGETVYAPMYRAYSGDYVFELERELNFAASGTRLVLLTENFTKSGHFIDDGLSLGAAENRRREQELFLAAFEKSSAPKKVHVCVTADNGAFKAPHEIMAEALA